MSAPRAWHRAGERLVAEQHHLAAVEGMALPRRLAMGQHDGALGIFGARVVSYWYILIYLLELYAANKNPFDVDDVEELVAGLTGESLFPCKNCLATCAAGSR